MLGEFLSVLFLFQSMMHAQVLEVLLIHLNLLSLNLLILYSIYLDLLIQYKVILTLKRFYVGLLILYHHGLMWKGYFKRKIFSYVFELDSDIPHV